jgi:AraC-like DNA-binding protein
MKATYTPSRCSAVQVLHEPDFHCFAGRAKEWHTQHVHGIHEFFVCTNNRGTQFADRTAIPQHRADLFCFPAGMPHHASGDAREPACGYVIMVPDFMFAPESYGDRQTLLALRHVVKLAQQGHNPLPLQANTRRRVLQLAGKMVEEGNRKQSGYQTASRILLEDIFLQIMRDSKMGVVSSLKHGATSRDERMAQAFTFIDSHCMESITVERMTKMTNMSRSHFHAIFRELAGCTLIEYVTRVRIKMAQRLLSESELPIVQIAMDCGFSSLSRFYEAFKIVTGKTPRAIRTTV